MNLPTSLGGASYSHLNLLLERGVENKWRSNSMGSEMRPEIQGAAFSFWPGGSGAVDNMKACIEPEHATWKINAARDGSVVPGGSVGQHPHRDRRDGGLRGLLRRVEGRLRRQWRDPALQRRDGGTASLHVYCLSDESRTATVQVNGEAATTVNFPATADWDTVGTVTVNVAVPAGTSIPVTIANVGGWAPDIDRIMTSG